ncbi:MAG: bifunctional (p)ppGpp synthetase/guanosine-3',5'-bis(diphosphate) 3'-pyrophosphohydrolase [Deltaproteobacteria bacterium]|nr:MAG: bifunctional (p)ppGpp synthetase/guanosine-3',5'-bis(diphosphate) 3'-pyrophosphohydrolase [Deltaproteobacteria bacterium]
MIQIDDILETLHRENAAADLEKVRRAFVFASQQHAGKTRLSGEPYISHPVEVARILVRLHLDADTIATGLLHDTLEDTPASIDELRREFGDDVAEMVDGVSKLSRISFRTSEQRQAESFRKMLLAMARDIRVILVKLADRLHNMRTLHYHPSDRQRAIARETLDIYAPLANRLGISWLKSELEDLSFAALEPETFREIEQHVTRHAAERVSYIEEVRRKLDETLLRHGIDGSVQGRVKHLWSVYKKMEKQGIDFDQVHDLIAFRIIVPSVRDCYAMLGIIHSAWRPIPGRFKDYIAMPKANMYQSLHTTVMGPGGQRMEVQIRTDEMHRIAEEGIAAHWKYKEGGGTATRGDESRFGWLRQLMEWQKELKDSREFMSSVKIDLFPEEVYVFTPNGDVKELPRDSTPVDFAYSVHSDLGHKCTGAKINGKLVPLKTPLKNGDIIEIVTSPNQTPSKDWLKFVKTSKARNRIRHWVKEQEHQKSVELGRELLEKELRKYGVAFHRAMAMESMGRVLTELSFRNGDDLLAAIGYGRVTTGQVIARLLPDRAKAEPPKSSRIGQVLDKIRKKPSGGIRVQGLDDIMVRFAKCCNPLPGDAVIGFISRGRGVTVHATDCPKVLETDPGRRIEVSWDLAQKASHAVKIRIYCTDIKGILAAMTAAITKCEANIARASAYSTGDGRAVNTFELNVSDVTHLNRVIDAIRKVKGVQRVERIRQGHGTEA